MSFIIDVSVYEDYKLLIELENGNSIILDMESKLDTLRFSILKNYDCFKSVKTDGCSVYWKNGMVRLSFNEILQMLRTVTYLSLVG